MHPRNKPTGWTVVVPDAFGAETSPDGEGRTSERQDDSGASRALLLRLKAEEARSAARAMSDPGAKQAMLQTAENYKRLAQHVAERDASQSQGQRPSAADGAQDAAQAQSND